MTALKPPYDPKDPAKTARALELIEAGVLVPYEPSHPAKARKPAAKPVPHAPSHRARHSSATRK